jgi:hypothetical protein
MAPYWAKTQLPTRATWTGAQNYLNLSQARTRHNPFKPVFLLTLWCLYQKKKINLTCHPSIFYPIIGSILPSFHTPCNAVILPLVTGLSLKWTNSTPWNSYAPTNCISSITYFGPVIPLVVKQGGPWPTLTRAISLSRTRPRPPGGSLHFHHLLCKRTHPYPVILLPIGLGYFQTKPSPVWIPQLFSNLVIIHLFAYEDGTECSETSVYKIQTPGNYPEENIQYKYKYCLYINLRKNYTFHPSIKCMLCPNKVLGFQNFHKNNYSSVVDSNSHVYEYELGSTSTRTIIDLLISYPYDRCEVVFKLYKTINVWEAVSSIFNGRIMETVVWWLHPICYFSYLQWQVSVSKGEET